jgi:hypothetical protein
MLLPIFKCHASAVWILQLYLKNDFEAQQNCNIQYFSRHILCSSSVLLLPLLGTHLVLTVLVFTSSLHEALRILTASSHLPTHPTTPPPPHKHRLCIRLSYLPWQPVLLWKWTGIREFKPTYIDEWEWKTTWLNSIIYMSQCHVHFFLPVFYFYPTSVFFLYFFLIFLLLTCCIRSLTSVFNFTKPSYRRRKTRLD